MAISTKVEMSKIGTFHNLPMAMALGWLSAQTLTMYAYGLKII